MKIYSSNYSSMHECAKDAEAKSYMHTEICTIVCDTESEYTDVVAHLQNNEDCIDYVDNNGVMDVWGVRHINIGNAEYRVQVYVSNPDLNRF
jgi:hypothetical protein